MLGTILRMLTLCSLSQAIGVQEKELGTEAPALRQPALHCKTTNSEGSRQQIRSLAPSPWRKE